MQQKNPILNSLFRTSTNFSFYLYTALAYLLAVGWLIFNASSAGGGVVVCPTKLLWHFPCPACGMTRATLEMFEGNFADGFLMNPNAVLVFLFIIIYPILLLFSLICNIRFLPDLCKYLNGMVRQKMFLVVFSVAEVLIWIHNVIIEM